MGSQKFESTTSVDSEWRIRSSNWKDVVVAVPARRVNARTRKVRADEAWAAKCYMAMFFFVLFGDTFPET